MPFRRFVISAVMAGTIAVGLFGISRMAGTEPGTRSTIPIATDLPDDPPRARVTGIGPWVRMQDPSVPIGVTYEYPGNWMRGTEEGRKQPYWQVVILGPRNASDTFSATLMVRRQPPKANGGLYKDLQDLVASRRRQRKTSMEYTLIEEGAQTVGGVEAQRAEFSYLMPYAPDRIEGESTRIQSTLLLFSVDGDLYEIGFSADVRDYPAYQPVLTHLLESLRLTAPSL